MLNKEASSTIFWVFGITRPGIEPRSPRLAELNPGLPELLNCIKLLNPGLPELLNCVKLATVVEGDQKAPFSIATTPRCRGGHYSFIWIAPLYPWCVPYIAECEARRYQVPFLKSLVWRDLGLNPGLLDHWRIYIYIYIYSHPQTDCFVLSELFSVARHAGRSKPRSKPVQLYVRLSLRSLGQQADQVG